MYYPILRGKQYELLALRECTDLLSTSPITPVIEPVRDLARSTGSVWRCLEALGSAQARACVIVNPAVGEYVNDAATAPTVLDMLDGIDPSGRMAIGIRVDPRLQASTLARSLSTRTKRPHIYIHTTERVDTPGLAGLTQRASSITHIAPERSRVRRYPSFGDDSGVAKFEDGFKRAERNSDYRDCDPYQFTDWNRYYGDDGYIGYSDYATIGEAYIEGGFTPRAVAIHLTYTHPDDSTIWIQHFVSQNGADSISNIKGKFAEAVAKLALFADRQSLKNPAIDEFRRLHERGQFAGLGVIKKLSLINHLYVAADSDA